MIYRIRSNENLFKEWRNYEGQTKINLLSSVVQNDMFLTTDQLNDIFSIFHKRLVELRKTYSREYLIQLENLRDKTVNYINNLNKIPLTTDEFLEFRAQCAYRQEHNEGFADQDYVNPTIHHCTNPHNNYQGRENCTLQNCPLMK